MGSKTALTLTVDQIRKELSLVPRGIREEKEKSMAEVQPRCKRHPDQAAVKDRTGRNTGMCHLCLLERGRKAGQSRINKSKKEGRIKPRVNRPRRIYKRKATFIDSGLTPPQKVRTCRVCGCTDEHACPGGCSWVQEDLCSACQEGLEREIFENHSKNKAANSINIYCMKCGFHMQIENADAFRGGQS